MGMDFSVAIYKARVPDVAAVCKKANDYGYQIELPKIDLLNAEDEVVGTFDGEAASFYLSAEPTSEFAELAEALELSPVELFGDRDTVLTMRPSSEDAGVQLTLVVCAAIVALCEGVFFDDFDNVDREPDRILAELESFDEDFED